MTGTLAHTNQDRSECRLDDAHSLAAFVNQDTHVYSV
jgi:hypothetical protein